MFELFEQRFWYYKMYTWIVCIRHLFRETIKELHLRVNASFWYVVLSWVAGRFKQLYNHYNGIYIYKKLFNQLVDSRKIKL